MNNVIFFSKDEDEYLVCFPPSFGFNGCKLSVPAGEETPESVHDYLREQIQDVIDGGDLDENIAEILQEYLDNCRFEEEISCEGQEAWVLIQKQMILEQQRIRAFNNMVRNPALNELL